MTMEIQKLRQKVVDALAEVQASHPPASDWVAPATPRGIQVGNIGAFGVVLRWIDEEIAEGK